MICRRRGQGWEIVFQRNHALLAAEMIFDWKPESRPQPWFQLLNACTQHDHGWNETVSDALVDKNGHPVDFLHMPMEVTLAMSRRNLDNASAQSRWCAILVARHAEYLYQSKDDDQTKAYLAELQAYRQTQQVQIGVSDQHMEEMYDLLCWADTLSLLVCCDPSDFTRSLDLTAQGLGYEAKENGSVWNLHPWPYRTPYLQLQYEVHYLEQDSFASDQELRDALSQAPARLHTVEIRP